MKALDGLCAAIKEMAREKGLVVFEGLPDLEHVPSMPWEGDWQGLLECAELIDAKLVYVKELRFEAAQLIKDAINPMRAMRTLSKSVYTPKGEAETDWLFERLSETVAPWGKYEGQIGVIGFAWLRNGIAHHWAQRADWHIELLCALESAMQEAEHISQHNRVVRSTQTSADLHDLSVQLATHPRFTEASSREKRVYMAEQLFGEAMTDDSWPLTADCIAERAELIYWWEIEPAEQRDKAERARQLRARGEPIRSIVAILKISESKVRAALSEEA